MDARLRLSRLKKMTNKRMVGMLQNAPFKFAPENGLAYFEDLGWRVVEDTAGSASPGQRAALGECDCSSYPLSPMNSRRNLLREQFF